MFTVVVRDEETKRTVVWRFEHWKSVRRKLRQLAGIRAPRGKWHNPSTDNFIRAFYNNGLSASEIARRLSDKQRTKITKNMIVGRARALKLCRPSNKERSIRGGTNRR